MTVWELVGVPLGVADVLADSDWLGETVSLGVPDTLPVPDTLAVALTLGDSVPDAELDSLDDCVTLIVGSCERVCELVGFCVELRVDV